MLCCDALSVLPSLLCWFVLACLVLSCLVSSRLFLSRLAFYIRCWLLCRCNSLLATIRAKELQKKELQTIVGKKSVFLTCISQDDTSCVVFCYLLWLYVVLCLSCVVLCYLLWLYVVLLCLSCLVLCYLLWVCVVLCLSCVLSCVVLCCLVLSSMVLCCLMLVLCCVCFVVLWPCRGRV